MTPGPVRASAAVPARRRVRVRFIATPTGPMNVGNARIAIANFLYARHFGGEFLLRFDRTDRARASQELADAICQDLHWLGIVWDRPPKPSESPGRYAAA